MAGTYRYWLICLPSVDTDSLVLFTENDHDGGNIRDYTAQGTVRVVRRVLLDDVPGVFRAATRRFSVKPYKAGCHGHWWNEIQRFSVELHKTAEPSLEQNEIQKRSEVACRAPTTASVGRSASSSLKGSKYHIQRWVNEYARELQCAIGDAFPLIAKWPLRWVSPLARESCREYQDTEFLQAIGLDRLSSDLEGFWPAGGPQWDALAVLESPRVGVILVEAKAYPGEAENRQCRAEGASRTKISERLDEVKAKLGVDLTADWMGSRYQVANRLAHLCFLRDHGVEAWYIQICFCDDVTHRPTTAERWREALPGLWRDLGLSTLPPFVADLLLPARDCDAEKVDSWAASCLVSLPSLPTRDRATMKLAQFIDVSGIADMGEKDKALYFAYYHLKKENVEEFTASEAAMWISANRLGNPNTVRLRANLADSSRTVRGSKAGTFRLHHNLIKTLDAKFPQLSEQSQEVVDSGSILPLVAYENTRGYIESLAKQVNACYEQHAYDGCAVLMRRLEEVLLLSAYQKLSIDSEIQDGNGNYKMLEAIVTNAQNNPKLKLSRNGKQAIEKIRALGNFSAHQITYQCRREYIAEKIDEYRALVQELLVKAGIR